MSMEFVAALCLKMRWPQLRRWCQCQRHTPWTRHPLVRAYPTTCPMFPQSHACYNVIDGRNRKLEIDTEMDTEIEMVMEIDTEIDTHIFIYGHIAVANVATSPIRSRSAMTRWERRSASAKRWVEKQPQPQSRPASGGGEAAVAAGLVGASWEP